MIQRLLRKLRATGGQVRFFYRRWLFSRVEKSAKPIKIHLLRGLVVELHPRGQIPELLFTSRFEREEIDLITAILKPGMNVLDIGANVGLYSVIAGKLIGKTGKLWAFEPSAETYNLLLANLSLNKTTSVGAIKIALSDIVDSVLTLIRDPGYKDGERYLSTRRKASTREAADSNDSGDLEIVKVTTLDSYMHADKRKCPRIDFMKIDVEGIEYNVLRGAKTILTKNNDIIVLFECTCQGCELSGHKIEDVFKYLQNLGFSLYGWCPKRRRWDDNEEYLRTVGNLWACRNKKSLPCP